MLDPKQPKGPSLPEHVLRKSARTAGTGRQLVDRQATRALALNLQRDHHQHSALRFGELIGKPRRQDAIAGQAPPPLQAFGGSRLPARPTIRHRSRRSGLLSLDAVQQSIRINVGQNALMVSLPDVLTERRKVLARRDAIAARI